MKTIKDLYTNLEVPEVKGQDIVIPQTPPIYLSEDGQCFAYLGVIVKDKEEQHLESWPFYLKGKNSKQIENDIQGFIRIKSGCLLWSMFLDKDFYASKSFKLLDKYVIKLPVSANIYYSVDERIEFGSSWEFEENEALTRECFGLTYDELMKLLSIYAEYFGVKNSYCSYPRLTRSTINHNFCDLTGVWIPPQFPYITFNSDSNYKFSHVSLFGFYKMINLLINTSNNQHVNDFVNRIKDVEIYNKLKDIDDYFPFEIILMRQHIYQHED